MPPTAHHAVVTVGVHFIAAEQPLCQRHVAFETIFLAGVVRSVDTSLIRAAAAAVNRPRRRCGRIAAMHRDSAADYNS